MDLGSPISSVIPSRHGVVLGVLARTTRPLSGRAVAELSNGRIDQKWASKVLRELAAAGVVIGEDQPPAKLWSLNRRHLAAESIVALAEMRSRLISMLEERIALWTVAPFAAWLFGSAARGDGDAASDVDVAVIRCDRVDEEDPQWREQLNVLSDDVWAWTGNVCALVEYSETEFDALVSGGERLPTEIGRDGLLLAGHNGLRPGASGAITDRVNR